MSANEVTTSQFERSIQLSFRLSRSRDGKILLTLGRVNKTLGQRLIYGMSRKSHAKTMTRPQPIPSRAERAMTIAMQAPKAAPETMLN